MSGFQVGDIAIPVIGGCYQGDGFYLNTYGIVTAVDGDRVELQYQAHYGCPWLVNQATDYTASSLHTEATYKAQLQARVQNLLAQPPYQPRC